jgi:hypothetical protein
MRVPGDTLVFGLIAAILAVLMFASSPHHSDIQQPPAIENAATNNR